MQLTLCLAIATAIALSHSEAREHATSTDSSTARANPSETQTTQIQNTQTFMGALDARHIHIKPGDTLLKMLSDAGVPPAESNKIVKALNRKMNLRKLQAGQALHLYLLPHARPGQHFRLVGLILAQGRETNWTLYRDNDYRFSTKRLPYEQATQALMSVLTPITPGPDGRFSKEIVVGRGDTLIGLLRATGADYGSASMASTAIGKHWDLRKLQPGQSLQLTFEFPGQHQTNARLNMYTT